MAEKTVKSRIQVKRGTSAEWALATNFVPKEGEIIFYSDLNKMKIGDGNTLVSSLPFLHVDKSEIDNWSHNHDDKYYTESEIDTKLSGKAASSHSHGNIASGGTLGTASRVVVTDSNKKVTVSSNITTTELDYLNGVTSNIQTQLNGKSATGHTHDDTYYTESEIDTKLAGKAASDHTHDGFANLQYVFLEDSSDESIRTKIYPGSVITPEIEINKIYAPTSSNSSTSGHGSSGQVLKSNGSSVYWAADNDTDTHYTTGLYVGATNTKSNATTSNGGTYLKLYDNSTKRSEFKITGSGATTVTSDANGNITISSTDTNTNTTYSAGTGLQLSGTTFSAKLNSTTSLGTIGTTSKLYAVGVDANGKLCVNVPWTDNNTTYTFHGAVSTIKDSNLTASRALISNSSGKVAVSDVTSTELSYLDGVTSNIQTQLNGKAASSHGTHVTAATVKSALGTGTGTTKYLREDGT